MEADGRVPLTAIILTQDEAKNISACLQCLQRVNDVVVVDSGSTDDTLAVARAARPDVRVFEHPFEDFGAQRNWALDHTDPAHQWVLFVDADEFCDAELIDEIDAFIADPGADVGGYIAGRNYFLGRWLRYSTMYPSYQLRLLKFGEVRFRKEGHGQKEITRGPLRYLRAGWRHEGFSKGVHQWIERHNYYSSHEAEVVLDLRSRPMKASSLVSSDPSGRRQALKQLGARVPLRAITRFLYAYFLRMGFLDGYPGLLYCMLIAAHNVHIVAKLAEKKHLECAEAR